VVETRRAKYVQVDVKSVMAHLPASFDLERKMVNGSFHDEVLLD
jgi:hypothetical protein